MKKRTIGQVLQLSRVNLQISLQDLAQKTAIEIPYIEALENDDFDLLPSPFYAQIYLKKLAWALGLDEKILLTAFQEKSYCLTKKSLSMMKTYIQGCKDKRSHGCQFFTMYLLVLL